MDAVWGLAASFVRFIASRRYSVESRRDSDVRRYSDERCVALRDRSWSHAVRVVEAELRPSGCGDVAAHFIAMECLVLASVVKWRYDGVPPGAHQLPFGCWSSLGGEWSGSRDSLERSVARALPDERLDGPLVTAFMTGALDPPSSVCFKSRDWRAGVREKLGVPDAGTRRWLAEERHWL
jgi:hypothetical protein